MRKGHILGMSLTNQIVDKTVFSLFFPECHVSGF